MNLLSVILGALCAACCLATCALVTLWAVALLLF